MESIHVVADAAKASIAEAAHEADAAKKGGSGGSSARERARHLEESKQLAVMQEA
jgi:hypothetical protein